MQQERVYLQFCKKLLGVKKFTQNDFVYGELGRVPLKNDIFYMIISYWFKILESEHIKYIQYAYQLMMTDIENKPDSVNLASKLRDLLSNLGFYGVWVNQGVGNKNMFLAEFKQMLNDNFIQNWNSRLVESSRANFYRLFSKFEHQLYLETIKVTKFRISLSKLRLSSHGLEIEVGRWARPNRTPLDQRKCGVCDKVDDEFHFLLECGSYSQIRKKYIKKYFWDRPNMIKLKELMQSTYEGLY